MARSHPPVHTLFPFLLCTSKVKFYHADVSQSENVHHDSAHPIAQLRSLSCPNHSITSHPKYTNIASKEQPRTGLVGRAVNIQSCLGTDFEIVQTHSDGPLDRRTLRQQEMKASSVLRNCGVPCWASTERHCLGAGRLDGIKSEKSRGQTQVQSSTIAHPSTLIRHRHGHQRFTLQTEEENQAPADGEKTQTEQNRG